MFGLTLGKAEVRMCWRKQKWLYEDMATKLNAGEER